jgi:hypothetical protein
MVKDWISRLLSLDQAEELPLVAAREPLAQLGVPTLDERASLYLRAVRGNNDFGNEAYSDARNRILNAMAADIVAKSEIHDEWLSIAGVLEDHEAPAINVEKHGLTYPAGEYAAFEFAEPLAAPPHLAAKAHAVFASRQLAEPDRIALPAMHAEYDKDEFVGGATAGAMPATPMRASVFSLRRIGTLSIIVCAAALMAGAGTLLFSRNDVPSQAWFAVEPRVVWSQPPREEPSPEVLAELAKVARALPTAETASRGPSVEVQAVASGSPIQQPSPEELAELEKRGRALLTAETALIGAGTASLLPSLAASQAVASGSPTLAAALAWYQNSR